jgi:hypothetical protein
VQVRQVDEDMMEGVAAVHQCSVGDESLAHQPRQRLSA